MLLIFGNLTFGINLGLGTSEMVDSNMWGMNWLGIIKIRGCMIGKGGL